MGTCQVECLTQNLHLHWDQTQSLRNKLTNYVKMHRVLNNKFWAFHWSDVGFFARQTLTTSSALVQHGVSLQVSSVIEFRTNVTSWPNVRWLTRLVGWTNQGEQQRVVTLDFEDHRSSFRHKRTRELLRAHCIFKLCAIEPIVSRQLQVRWHHPTWRHTRNIVTSHSICSCCNGRGRFWVVECFERSWKQLFTASYWAERRQTKFSKKYKV